MYRKPLESSGFDVRDRVRGASSFTGGLLGPRVNLDRVW